MSREGARGRRELPAAPCSSTGSCPLPWSLASAQPQSQSFRRAGQSLKTRLFCGCRQDTVVSTCWRCSQKDWPCHEGLHSYYDQRAQRFAPTNPPGKEKLQLPTSRRSPTKAQGEKSGKARGQVEDDCHTSCGSSLLQLGQWVSSQDRQELRRYQTS